MRNPLYTLIKKTTSDLDYGYHYLGYDGKKKIARTKNEVIVAALQARARGEGGRPARLPYLTYSLLDEHCSGDATYFYQGTDRGDFTLLLLDIDCKGGIGSKEGSFAFAEFLKNQFFQELYHEESTNGIGRHGYILIETKGIPAVELNRQFKKLQSYLRQYAQDFDVSDIEIKGRCPVINWSHYKQGKISSYKAGQLAKLPRGDFSSTTRVSIEWLENLPEVDSKVRKKTPQKEQPKTRKSEIENCSSISGRHIELDPRLRRLVKDLIYKEGRPATGKISVLYEDIFIFLTLLEFFTKDMRRKGEEHLPVARWRAMWTALYNAGDTTRSFHCQRFKLIRDWLTDLGMIDWTDENYWFIAGRAGQGRACKWQADEELLSLIAEKKEKKTAKSTSYVLLKISPDSKTLPKLLIRPIGHEIVIDQAALEHEAAVIMGLAA